MEVDDQVLLTANGIAIINRIVETLTPDDAHHAIGILRNHLEARAVQTAPAEGPAQCALPVTDDLSDLLGV